MIRPLPAARLAIALSIAGLSTAAVAEEPQEEAGGFGLGLAGHSWGVGLAARYNLSSRFAVQGILGRVAVSGAEGIGLGADFRVALARLTDNSDVSLQSFAGAGAVVGTGTNSGNILGISPFIGLQLNIKPVPIDVHMDIRPQVALLPDPSISFFGIGLGARYWF